MQNGSGSSAGARTMKPEPTIEKGICGVVAHVIG